jgi:hypothetical protein
MHVFLAVTTDGRWHPGIGDPTWMGWSTVVAYLVAAILSGVFAYHTWLGRTSRWRTLLAFWAGLALILVLLAINKQLDLQSLFTQIGRDLAKRLGWYAERRVYQQRFILGLLCAGVATLVASSILLIGTWRRTGLALFGLIFLVVFILVRAASFHHVGHLLGVRFAGMNVNWLLEMGGIFCIGLAAGLNLLSIRKS